MDLVTNYVVITDTIKFVQQFQRRLRILGGRERKKLILYPSDSEKHNKKQKNMIIMTKMLI
jgi:hypothetical protein